MDQSTLREFENRCIQEAPPPCSTYCPLHVDARGVSLLMARGETSEARKLLDRAMPLADLLGRLCEGPCREHCRRAEVDTGVNLPLLERACVASAAGQKPFPLPPTGKTVHIIGAGLSSLTAASELGKKGHACVVHHAGPIGAELCAVLPAEALETALELLRALRVVFEEHPALPAGLADSLLGEKIFVYLGLDDPAVGHSVQTETVVPLTLETERPGILAGGFARNGISRHIDRAEDGKRAAGSIDRLLQGALPGTAREGEGAQPSRLFTDISGAVPAPEVVPAAPAAPTHEEASAEGARCLDCQCLECVKRCPYLAHFKGYPKKYAREIYNNLAVLHGLHKGNTLTDTCAQCGLCAEVCPHDAHMGTFTAQARREMVKADRMPPSAHEFLLEEMEEANGLAFFRHQPGTERSARLFFPGCRLAAGKPAKTTALYRYLAEHLPQTTGAGLGFAFGCCGAPARWSGRDKATAGAADVFRTLWEQAGKPEVLLGCASCGQFFAAEHPDIPIRSVWEALAELPLPPTAAPAPGLLALHDPCAARHAEASQAGVRRILRSIGQEVEELTLGRSMTRCCGFGGAAAAASPEVGAAYAQSRADDTVNPVLCWCAVCREQIRKTGKPALHLLDLLFPGDGAQAVAALPAAGISERRAAMHGFCREVRMNIWNESVEAPAAGPRLHVPPDVAERLENRRILLGDIRTVLAHAEAHGAAFRRNGSDRLLACLRPRQVTFWVEYSKEPDGAFTIHDAYCHRMVVPDTPGEGRESPASREGMRKGRQ